MKRHRTVLVLAIGALLVSAIAGILPIDAGIAQTQVPATDPLVVTLDLMDIRFEPATLEIPADQDVIVRVENKGAALHDFVVPELDIAVEVAPGESTEITINAPAGRYSIICSVPGHKEAGMVGTLLVKAPPAVRPSASPSPSATETATPLPATPATAMDAPGCEGLAGYSTQILAIETDRWNQLVAEFGIADESDLVLLEVEQFTDLTAILDTEAALLLQVEAPGFAEAWHQTEIAYVEMFAAAARLAPQAGSMFAAELMLWDVSEILAEQQRQTYLDAVAACPAFETFWNELSLIDGDAGTPPDSTSDYSSCEGLATYDSNLRRAFVQALANHPDLAADFFEFSEASQDDLFARTPTELLMIAAVFQEVSGEIAKVTPPDYASEWHLSQVMNYGAIADYLKAAAADGFESADAEFGEQFGVIGILGDAAAEKATDECAVFYEFATS